MFSKGEINMQRKMGLIGKQGKRAVDVGMMLEAISVEAIHLFYIINSLRFFFFFFRLNITTATTAKKQPKKSHDI